MKGEKMGGEKMGEHGEEMRGEKMGGKTRKNERKIGGKLDKTSDQKLVEKKID
jgi:hypothetical protein